MSGWRGFRMELQSLLSPENHALVVSLARKDRLLYAQQA